MLWRGCGITHIRFSKKIVLDSSEKDSPGLKITELARAKRDLTAKYEAEHARILKVQAERNDLQARLVEAERKIADIFHDQDETSKRKVRQ